MLEKNITIPSWKEIEEKNNVFIKEKKYKGYEIDIPLAVSEAIGLDLHILISCQNEQFIFKNNNGEKAENVLRFALCNRAGFAIASRRYVYCEEGYKAGIEYLKNAANVIKKSLGFVATEI